MNASQQTYTIHPRNYGPIQRLQQHRPTPDEPTEVVLTVEASVTPGIVQPQLLRFNWRTELNCWYATQPLCIKA